jgi:threonine/homoserine efflux transporter RhtA
VMPLIMLLYELLKIVNRRIALLAVFFSLVGSAVQSAALLGHFAPLILLKRGQALGVSQELLQAQTYMALQLQGIGYAIALTFFGGTMLARGYLISRSSFLPRFIGVFLAIEGVCYLANSFADFVAPGIAGTVFAVLMVTALAEVLLCLWLLVKGVNVAKWQEQRASS